MRLVLSSLTSLLVLLALPPGGAGQADPRPSGSPPGADAVPTIPPAAGSPELGPPRRDEEGIVVTLNLPARTLEVYRDGERIRAWPATIGLPDHPTPTGAFEIGRIEWNPWWNPPDSDWARNEVRTPPGPSNPMGRAKLHFVDLLFLHGSPGSPGGADSHGCIRIANEHVLELARLLALDAGVLLPEEIDALERSASRTRAVVLPDPVPLRIRYRVAEIVDGEIRVWEDVYRYGVTRDERRLMEAAPTGDEGRR